MRIESFTFEAGARERFIDLAFQVRRADPKWIPPFRSEVRNQLSEANPFLAYGELRNFLAYDGERPVARCTAMVNPKLDAAGGPVGLVGFFESEPGQEAAKAVLDAAVEWLRGKGKTRVLGPMNFSIWHQYRFMTKGFDRDVFMGEPYNPPYYPEQFGAYGFKPLARYFSWDLEEPHLRGMLAASEKMAAPQVVEEAGLKLRPLDVRRFEEQMRHVHALLVEAFSENMAFSPIAFEEFIQLFGWMKGLVVPELIPLVWAPNGDAIGFAYLFPDYSEALRAMKGETGLRARLKFWAMRNRPKRLILHTMGAKKEYRRKGLVETFLVGLLREALSRGFTRGIGALAKEGPTLYAKTGPAAREYTLYSLE